jgi:pantetheine-phosphate adenylyltransferase
MKRIALFPGSFDPFTKGHEDIVLRGLQLFDEIIIAIGYNSGKTQRYFPIDLMLAKIKLTFSDKSQISVLTYSELTAEYAKKNGAKYLLRGLRNTTDFEYENSISQVNKHLNSDLESVFLITSPGLAAISSSIIREVHKYQGDVTDFLPYKLP